jgi:hypothetical protein
LYKSLRSAAGRLIIVTAVLLGNSMGTRADADDATPANSLPLRKVRMIEEGAFTSVKGSAQGVPARLWDRASEVPSIERGVSWRGLSDDRIQWRFAPESMNGFVDSTKARIEEKKQVAEPTFVRTIRFDVTQSKETPQLERMSFCKYANTGADSTTGCTEVPLRTVASPFQVIALPGQARLPVVFRSGRQICFTDFTLCSFALSTWRLAQELTGFSDGGRDVPDLVWIEPHAKGTLAIYDLRLSQHWATVELPENLGQRVGSFRSASVTDNRVLVANFSAGSLLLDFVGDTCRLLLPGEVWSCKEGLGASVVWDWLGGRYAAPSQEKKPGFSARAANWKLSMQQVGSEQLRAGLDGALPLAQSLDVALFTKAQITFRRTSEVARWENLPFELERGFVLHRRESDGEKAQLDWGGFGVRPDGNGTAQGGMSYRCALWHKEKAATFRDLDLPKSSQGLPLQAARDGVFFAASTGLKYFVGSESKNTSIEAGSHDVNLLGPDEALVRRGAGVTCEMVHLISHRDFPASFLESGLVLPCETSWRASRGFHGSVLAAWNKTAEQWLVRWLN